jgi:hypothetical protein
MKSGGGNTADFLSGAVIKNGLANLSEHFPGKVGDQVAAPVFQGPGALPCQLAHLQGLRPRKDIIVAAVIGMNARNRRLVAVGRGNFAKTLLVPARVQFQYGVRAHGILSLSAPSGWNNARKRKMVPPGGRICRRCCAKDSALR